jgi:carotenoid cleavage dioxygenase-like enzyme
VTLRSFWVVGLRAGRSGRRWFRVGAERVFHDLGALVVEDEQVLVGLDQIDGLPGEEPGDVSASAPVAW